MNKESILTYLLARRRELEKVWCEATASPNMHPTAGKPITAGQCSATSLVLFDELTRLPDFTGRLEIAVGSVWDVARHEAAIPLHVWLQLSDGDMTNEPFVIDLTADQAPHIATKVTLATTSELVQTQQLAYLANALLRSVDEAKEGTRRRAVLLRDLLLSLV